MKVGDPIYIPTSNLGCKYGIGKIVAIWSNKISVDFSGHLGQYTVDKHDIIPAEIFGMKVVLDETIPKDEMHIKFGKATIEKVEEID